MPLLDLDKILLGLPKDLVGLRTRLGPFPACWELSGGDLLAVAQFARIR
jgi:hypothetical protein